MSDPRIQANVQKMIDAGAPPEHIDGYLQTEGLTPETFKSYVASQEPPFVKEDGIDELPNEFVANGRPTTLGDKLGLAAGNQKAMADIAMKNIPGATARFDKAGNAIIRIPGETGMVNRTPYTEGMGQSVSEMPLGKDKEFYLNAPGASEQDLTANAPEFAALAVGGGVGGSLGKALLGGLGRVVGAGVGSGAASMALDKVAQGAGSKQPVDLHKAGVNALWGSGGELAMMGGAYLLNKVMGTRALFNHAAGELTDKGKSLLKDLDVDPDEVTAAFQKAFGEKAAVAAKPADALAAADAASLPTPVKLTQGDMTRDVPQQALEDSMLKGGAGDRAKNIMQTTRAEQQDALRANLGAISERVGGATVRAPGEGADAAAAALRAQAKTEKAGVNAAYDAARTSGEAIDKKPFADMVSTVGQDLRNNFDLGALTNADRLLQQAESIVENGTKPGQGLEAWRTRVSNAMKTANRSNPTEALALKKLLNGYDEMISQQVDQGLLAGDWAKAVKARKSFGERFQSDKIIDTIVRNKVPADQAVNYLFGAGRLGYGKNATEALVKMKGLLGENSEAWQGLKQEAFMRLTRDAKGPLDQGMEAAFSGTKFANNLDDALARSPTLMRTMFNKDEIALLQQFKRVALRATNKVEGAVNHSNTATEMSRIAQRLFGPASTVAQTIYSRFVKPVVGEARAISATRGVEPAQPYLLTPGIFGATGATLSERPPR